MRLDVLLGCELGLSRSQVVRLLGDGRVSVEGRVVTSRDKGFTLQPGQRVTVGPFTRPEDQQPIPQAQAPLQILAEGSGYVVVHKLPGVAVHPLEPNETGTLLNALVARYPAMLNVGEGGLRCGVVHRLDIETSGVMLFATTQARWEALREAFSSHQTHKLYHAIVIGHPEKQPQTLRMNLRVTQHSPARVKVVDGRDPGGRPCDLTYKMLESLGNAALVEVQLGTGFLHQVRVMLAHVGLPLAGDPHYQPEGFIDPTGSPRVMLHAQRIVIGDIDVSVPSPEDFLDVLARLRGAV